MTFDERLPRIILLLWLIVAVIIFWEVERNTDLVIQYQGELVEGQQRIINAGKERARSNMAVLLGVQQALVANQERIASILASQQEKLDEIARACESRR